MLLKNLTIPKEIKLDSDNEIWNKYGYCYYTFQELEPGGIVRAAIYNLYTYPLYRRNGHAKRLLNEAIAAIRKYGYNGNIVIEAIPNECSISKECLIKFYESMGLIVLNKYNNEFIRDI